MLKAGEMMQVTSTGYSSRGPRFVSQDPGGSSEPVVTAVPRGRDSLGRHVATQAYTEEKYSYI